MKCYGTAPTISSFSGEVDESLMSSACVCPPVRSRCLCAAYAALFACLHASRAAATQAYMRVSVYVRCLGATCGCVYGHSGIWKLVLTCVPVYESTAISSNIYLSGRLTIMYVNSTNLAKQIDTDRETDKGRESELCERDTEPGLYIFFPVLSIFVLFCVELRRLRHLSVSMTS